MMSKKMLHCRRCDVRYPGKLIDGGVLGGRVEAPCPKCGSIHTVWGRGNAVHPMANLRETRCKCKNVSYP